MATTYKDPNITPKGFDTEEYTLPTIYKVGLRDGEAQKVCIVALGETLFGGKSGPLPSCDEMEEQEVPTIILGQLNEDGEYHTAGLGNIPTAPSLMPVVPVPSSGILLATTLLAFVAFKTLKK